MSKLIMGVMAALIAVIAVTLALDGDRSASANIGGPVVLMGIDAEDGGVGGHGPISVYVDVANSMLANVGNGGSGILVIGGGKAADDVTDFWDEIGSQTGQTVTYVNGPTNIAGQSFAGFAMIGVVSGVSETSDGGLTQDENDALAARVGDVAAFVNAGGGLFGFSQSGMTNPYEYVGGFGSFVVNINLGYDDITPTTAGADVGITDDLDLCCWHDTYETFPDFLEVLATQNDSSEDFFGQAAAIGGAQVIILPEGPFGSESCTDQIDNDVDTLLDTEDPDCAPPVTESPTPTATAAAATASPTPTPTALPAQALPETGGPPSTGGNSGALILALAGFAVVLGTAALYSSRRPTD